jgi:cytochrome c2
MLAGSRRQPVSCMGGRRRRGFVRCKRPMTTRHFESGRWLGGTVLVIVLLSTFALPEASATAGDAAPPRGDAALEGLHTIGPPLTALPTKLADPRWLVAWLQKPSRLRRHPLMRSFRLSAAEAQAVAEYLYAGNAPPRRSVRWQGGDPNTGEALFVSRGCRGCHAIELAEQSFSPRIPNLAGIGIKVRGDWLFEWLKSPRSYDPDTAMPQLGLSDDEARHLVAFLLSHREGADVFAATPRFRRRGAADLAREAIRRFDCAKCHLLRGARAVSPATGWAVAPRACANCHAPSSWSAAAREAQAPGGNSPEATALRDGRRLVAYYNCGGCHSLEGSSGAVAQHLERKTFAPPTLDGEGARVQTSWLIDYLRKPTNLRLWMQMRMPDYGLSYAEAAALARYFAALSQLPPLDEPHDGVPPAIAERGARRFAHFKCVQCHPAGADVPLPRGIDVEDLSTNLMLVKTRLRPSWIRDFLARPKAVVGTETRMPAVFYTADGIPKIDHPDEDIGAITAYLLQMTEPPSAVSEESQPRGVADQQPIDWTTHAY